MAKRGSWSRSKRNDGAAPRVAAAERREEHVRAARAAPLAPRLAEPERDRRGGRISVLLDVVNRLLLGDPELVADELVDPEVRLMRDEQVDVAGGELGEGQHLARDLGHLFGRPAEDVFAIHRG